MRSLCRSLCAAALALAFSDQPARADDFPTKQVLLIIPFSPGSGADLFARSFVPGIRADLNVPVVVENREGAAGLIGLMDAARAPSDGYTLVMSAEPPFALAPLFLEQASYDPLKTFAPVARVGAVPMILVTSSQSPVKSLSDLRQYVTAHPDKAYYASNGNASPAQVSMELLKAATGLKIQEVSYKSTTTMTTDVAGNHLLAVFLSVSSGAALIQGGKLVALAVGSKDRLKKFPTVPTLAEAIGQPDYRADVAYEFFAPAKTPADRIQRIYAAMAKSYASPQVQASMEQLSVIPDLKSPAEFGQLVRKDWENAQKIFASLKKK